MAQTAQTQDANDGTNTIVLPEDRPIRAFIMAAAAFSGLEQLVTKYPYLLDLKNRQITSLTEEAADLDRAVEERIDYYTQKVGSIEHLHGKRVIKRPANLVTAFILVVVASSIILYGQYNTIWRDYVVNGFIVNAPYIAVVVFLFGFLFAWAIISRRRRGRGK